MSSRDARRASWPRRTPARPPMPASTTWRSTSAASPGTRARPELAAPAYPTPIPAQNNWWGCNYGPGGTGTGCTGANGVSGAITVDPWLVLALAAIPAAVGFRGTSALTRRLLQGQPRRDRGGRDSQRDASGLRRDAGHVAGPLAAATAGRPRVDGVHRGHRRRGTEAPPRPSTARPSPASPSRTRADPHLHDAVHLAPGQPDFTLTLTGTNFLPGAVVLWNGTPLPDAVLTITGTQITVICAPPAWPRPARIRWWSGTPAPRRTTTRTL